MTLTLTIRLSTSARFTLPSAGSSPITPSTTILEIKQLISQHDDSGRVEVGRQRLIYKGRILSENEKTLADYGINESNGETVLYLVKGSGGGTSAPAPAASTSAPAPPPPASSAPPNPFAIFGQMGGAQGGMPNLQQMQQQLQQNPQFMSEMMNNPMVQSLMSNPDFMSQMMESNPQMQQVLNSNPELRQALRDPELMRRSMEMMRDPSQMQQMMRNQDLAMSQIENMPGGYNALRRMYEDVQLPMMDAMSAPASENAASSSGVGQTGTNNSGARNQAMPNPWGSSSTTSAIGNTSNNAASSSGASNPANMFNPFAMPNMGAGGVSNPWANPGGAAGSTQQLEATIQMLENPIMQQMMDQMMSNPEAVRSMMESNPMMRQMRESNPQVAAMMENPEVMRAMMNPQTLRSMMQIQQAFSGLTPPGGAQTTGGAPAGGLDFSNLLGGRTSAPAAAAPMPNPFLNFPFAPPQQPAHQPAPGERFRNQLQSLNDMGFTDRSSNINALVSAHGNVNRAIEILLESPPEMPDTQADSGAADTNAAAGGGLNEQAGEGREGEEPKGNSEKKND